MPPVKVTYQVWPDAEGVALAAAKLFANKVEDAVKTRGLARVAISGGTTPSAMFKLLANPGQGFANTLPWDKLELYWVDERCVPPTDPSSNYGTCKQLLLDHVGILPGNVYRIKGELDPEEASSIYESEMRNAMKLEGAESPRFDLLLLGMGDDGHTASLFPHTEALNDFTRLAVANHVPQQPTLSWRITLTWPVIIQAAEVAFQIAGEKKTDPLAKVLLGPRDPETFPSQLIRPSNGRLLFQLDEIAAAKLPAASEVSSGGDHKVGVLEI